MEFAYSDIMFIEFSIGCDVSDAACEQLGRSIEQTAQILAAGEFCGLVKCMLEPGHDAVSAAQIAADVIACPGLQGIRVSALHSEVLFDISFTACLVDGGHADVAVLKGDPEKMAVRPFFSDELH